MVDCGVWCQGWHTQVIKARPMFHIFTQTYVSLFNSAQTFVLPFLQTIAPCPQGVVHHQPLIIAFDLLWVALHQNLALVLFLDVVFRFSRYSIMFIKLY